MSKIIPITSLDELKGSLTTHPQVPDHLQEPVGTLIDAHGRKLHDLRISITDRCNFRC
jgi:cyclic pyranopterin phosphate synthase